MPDSLRKEISSVWGIGIILLVFVLSLGIIGLKCVNAINKHFLAENILKECPQELDFNSFKSEGDLIEGANFALHYKVATFECGEECQYSSIVNLETNTLVVFRKPSIYGVSYKENSDLFIINPKNSLDADTIYYKIMSDNLIGICKESYE